MSGAKARLLELFEQDHEVRKILEDWATERSIQCQDLVISELMKREPSDAAAIQKAAASKVYEELVQELLAYLKV